MKSTFFVLGAAIGFVVLLIYIFSPKQEKIPTTPTHTVNAMRITSPVFENNSPIPKKYSCQGEGVSPPLTFSEIPKDAKSLALIVDDPDAPAGTFVHWVVYYLPPSAAGIEEHLLPASAKEGLNGTKKTGYIGPCPPTGEHRYHFKLYALDAVLNFASPPDKQAVEDAMKNHTLGTAELVGLYRKGSQ